jgi:hypothetical protein
MDRMVGKEEEARAEKVERVEVWSLAQLRALKGDGLASRKLDHTRLRHHTKAHVQKDRRPHPIDQLDTFNAQEQVSIR